MDNLLFSILALVSFATVSGSVVNTTIGEVQGEEIQTSGIETFLGIPYAEAPEGELRFKPPVRKARIEGVYKAVTNKYVCPQQTHLFLIEGTFNMTEDCLRLDIYKPLQASKFNPLPVMVWVHGGGYVIGDSKSYNGIALAAQHGVILVVINYRLGVLGFLDTLDEHSIGNFGLRDQCSAIEWVNDNIEEFGGNSSSVTIFGESAGASSIIQLALSSLCHGKFHRVIAQSASPSVPWSYNKNPLKAARDFATKAGCPTETDALVTCLRKKSFEDLIRLQAFVLPISTLGTWSPSYRGDVFPEDPLEIFKNAASSVALKRFRSLDLLIGVMQEEGELSITYDLTGQITGAIMNLSIAIVSDEAMEERIRNNLRLFVTPNDDVIEKLLPSLKFQYTDWMNQDDSFGNTRMLVRLDGDLQFMVGTVQAARRHAGAMTLPQEVNDSGKTFFYQFIHKSSWASVYPWSDGGTHGEDISYLFGYTSINNGTTEEEELSRTMMEYWTNFAKTGNPNYPNRSFINTTWPPFDAQTEKFVKLDVNMSPNSTSQFPFARRVAFWDQLVPAQIKAVEDFKKEMKAMKEKQEEKCKQSSGSIQIFSVCSRIYLLALLLYCVL